jgi:hypothetical protein
MSNVDSMPLLSPRRQRLASFENAYAVALRKRRQSGRSQFILKTANPVQPFRATSQAPERDEQILALVA